MAHGLRTCIVSMRMWVHSLAALIGLRSQCCCKLWHRAQMRLRSGIAMAVAQAPAVGSDSTPSLGMPICHRCSCRKKFI